MKQILARLRAALSAPAVIAMLAAFALVCMLRMDTPDENTVTALESKAGAALARIEGAGSVNVVIRTKKVAAQGQSTGFGTQQTAQDVPCGAIAVVEGADDPYVRMQVMQALCALLGLQAAQVNVLSAAGG